MADLRNKAGYHVVAQRRGEPPKAWIWEIYHCDKPLGARLWGGYFKTHDQAIEAGRWPLEQFLRDLKKETKA
jgi:hypothetical protein